MVAKIIFLVCLMAHVVLVSLEETVVCWEENGFGKVEIRIKYKENERQVTDFYLQKGNMVVIYCKPSGACLVVPSLQGDVWVQEVTTTDSRVVTVTCDKLYGRISPEGKWSVHHAQIGTLNDERSCDLSMSDFLIMTFNGKRAKSIDLDEGADLNVECQQSHHMTSTLDIFQEDEKLAESVNNTVAWNKSDISCSLSGTYRCVRRNSTKFVETKLNVLCAPKLIGISNDYIPVTSRLHRNVSVRIEIISNPHPRNATVFYESREVCTVTFAGATARSKEFCHNQLIIDYVNFTRYSGTLGLFFENLQVDGTKNITLIISNGVGQDLMTYIAFQAG